MQSSLPPEVDILVVGYGPVGEAVTCLLGQYGVRTRVIDKAADIFLAPRAIALDNEALRVLQLAGLTEGAFARLPIPQVRMVCPYLGEFARFNTSGTLDGHRRQDVCRGVFLVGDAAHVTPPSLARAWARACATPPIWRGSSPGSCVDGRATPSSRAMTRSADPTPRR